MILKSIMLENIRSYANQTIEFPLGTTLFEGDIGSGKSTILMAIEFALFGLGSEKGAALLRVGAKKGSVTLTFEVEGEEYKVYRCLEKKGKSVQQSDGYIKTKEGILHLSASELKEKILEILKFNEPPDPKAQSVIYRYAVFTPQEEMKAILWMKPDLRLQTLRKAFRVEDYRIAIDNALTIVKLIKEKAISLSSHASDLEKKQEACNDKKAEMQEYRKQLENLQKSENELKNKKESLNAELEKLQKQKDELGKAVGEVPLLKSQIEEKNKEILNLQKEEENLTNELNEKIQPIIEELSKIEKPTSKSEEELSKEMSELRVLKENLIKEEASIESKINDYELIERNGVCPTCDRLADPKEFMEKVEQKKKEKEKLAAIIKDCDEKILELDRLQKLLRRYNQAQGQLKILKEQAEKVTEQLSKVKAKKNALNEQVKEASKKLEKAKKELEEYNQLSFKVEMIRQELNKTQEEFTKIGKEITSRQAMLKALEKEVAELEIEIETKAKERKMAEKLNEHLIWIEEFFVPTMGVIEKHVMLSINQEFNQHFQRWWSLLVDDTTKEARIDEEFTPLVEQDGYELNINYLSGGEKTSLALAYRLALNSIVQKVSTGMKSNLLILDEPTDGFSKEQLFKIREILNEIKCPQVIIVSHEKELESFADQVFKVEKKSGVSEVKIV
ncbi:MAG: AAA family ATPase [Thermoproteota archaeon]